MAVAPSRLSRIRARLARRLGLRAVAGLSALGLLIACLGLLAVLLVGRTWDALVAGDVFHALLSVAAFMLAVAAAALCFGWLFAPTAQPEGVRLPRESAQSLYRLVDSMGVRFGGIRIDSIWIVGDMNTAVLQRPRWGWVGPLETHMMIGLPLAHSVSRRQFSAILAHEFAHLACQR